MKLNLGFREDSVGSKVLINEVDLGRLLKFWCFISFVLLVFHMKNFFPVGIHQVENVCKTQEDNSTRQKNSTTKFSIWSVRLCVRVYILSVAENVEMDV